MEDQKIEVTNVFFDFDGVITNRDGQATFNEFGKRRFPCFGSNSMSNQLIRQMAEDKCIDEDCNTMRKDAMEVLLSVVLDPSKHLIILSNNHRVYIVRMLFEALKLQYSQLAEFLVPLADQFLRELNAWVRYWQNIPSSESMAQDAPPLSFLEGGLILVDRSSCLCSKVDYMIANSNNRSFLLIDDSVGNFRSNEFVSLKENQYYHVNRDDVGFFNRSLADIYACALEKLESHIALDSLPPLPAFSM